MKIILTALIMFAAFILWPTPKKSIPFSMEAIQSDMPFHPEWATRILSPEEDSALQEALSQSFRYLGSGGQCYVFVSADDQYVIKFFKQKSFAIDPWVAKFPIPYLIDWLKVKKKEKKERVRSNVFNAFRHSFDHLSQETGMLYVHLNRTSHLNKTLSLTDARGVSHLLQLDDLEFAIQKKAELAFRRIDSLMRESDVEGAKKAILKLLKLNLSLSQKGYRNRDPNFRSNCGFVGEEAILFDVGRIVPSEEINEPENISKAFKKSTPKFRKYLTENYPDLLKHFDACVEELTQKYRTYQANESSVKKI